MTKYIDKDAVVKEIKRLKECNRKICGGDFDFLKKAYPEHYYSTEIYNDILSFLNTLEVKEVDLGKEINLWVEENTCNGYCSASIHETAEHFFELGLKTQKGDDE